MKKIEIEVFLWGCPQTPKSKKQSCQTLTTSQVTRLDTQPCPLLLPGWLKGHLR